MRIIATSKYRVKTLTLRDDALIIVLSGRKQLIAAEQTLDCVPQQGLMIARGTQWDVVNDPAQTKHYEALAFAFESELIREFEASGHHVEAAKVSQAQVLAVDAELQEAALRLLPAPSGKALSASLHKHRSLELLLLLAERGFSFQSLQVDAWEDRVRRLIAQRPHADWKVESLAEAFHMSPSSLRRRFQGTETRLAALVREVRLEVALGMLQTTRLPIGEVAQRCGWASHSRFSAMFQQRWGVAPSAIRANFSTGD